MPAVMVQGTASSVGKSLITTALCRLAARRGMRVAPFKAQNMSNNARVVNGGEIGAAQWVQALAAGFPPDIRVNPVLVKPEGGGSQVVVEGKVDPELSSLAWERRPPRVWPVIRSALRSLLAEVDLVIIEGAGSPAEVNLTEYDVVNMAVAREADARVYLVADIDRGGAFAHLYGTWALLDPDDRRRIAGFLLNKFRGDPRLLGDGPSGLEGATGVPTLGVIPWIRGRLPEEDGYLADPSPDRPPRAAVVRYPTASNLDELRRLEETVDVVYATRPAQLADVELVILPGSKDVPFDLGWLHRSGLAAAVAEAAGRRVRVLGICGGLQMLGRRIEFGEDVHQGLGLLPVDTHYRPDKLVTDTVVELRVPGGPWRVVDGVSYPGYEIRQGRLVLAGIDRDDSRAVVVGSVLGITAHGMLESAEVLGRVAGEVGGEDLEGVVDRLADVVEASLVAPVEELLG